MGSVTYFQGTFLNFPWFNCSANNKQMFYAFLFNIKNYSREVSNIQRREAELNIILLKVNNFDIKQKSACKICFIIYS